jgi:hypothetical protein
MYKGILLLLPQYIQFPLKFLRGWGGGTISVKALQRAVYEVHNSRTARLAIERRKQSSGRAGKRDKGD